MNVQDIPSRTDWRAAASLVKLASVVDLEEMPTGRRRTVWLVAPPRADECEDGVSTFDPTGQALLGPAAAASPKLCCRTATARVCRS